LTSSTLAWRSWARIGENAEPVRDLRMLRRRARLVAQRVGEITDARDP
jgi:hypothetical protein